MAIQTNYADNIDAGRVGAIVNTEPSTLISRTVEDAAGIAFGLPVAQGSEDNGITATLTGVTELVGITVRERSVNPATPDKFAQYESARLMRKGVIWVTVTDAGGVAAGDAVWLNLANGTYSNADVGSGGGLRLAGSRWETSAANGALAQLRVDLDVPAVAGAA
ncbi:hypothetical protein JET14_13295 [Martelella lutilitoris]|uniref:DUF2190 family protein n=1 Tax=Martelella lutilitoris TaxID=2583532 RepID=A0A7T7HHM2_9HYPH|nr:hypothetical protein [Martelella lutilitoris]QQM29302.1 hypothetical protein JET14_13295 [Martelella lutilitoris]